jgi:hypothetical protein
VCDSTLCFAGWAFYACRERFCICDVTSFCWAWAYILCVCPAWASDSLSKIENLLGGESPLQASCRSLLASCKGVRREAESEGSRTAKVGTDEQKSHKRLGSVGKMAQHIKARRQQTFLSRCGRHQRKADVLTRGELSER